MKPIEAVEKPTEAVEKRTKAAIDRKPGRPKINEIMNSWNYLAYPNLINIVTGVYFIFLFY